MRWPLRLQILIPFTLLVAATLLAVTLVNAYFAASATQAQIEEQLRGVGRTLADTNFPLNETVLEQMSGLSGAGLVLFDEAGQTTAASRALRSIELTVPAGATLDQARLGDAIAIGDEHYLSMALRLPDRPDRASGTLQILYPERVLSDAKRRSALPSLIVGLIAVPAVIVFGIVLAGRITRPLSNIAAHVGELTEPQPKPLPLPPRNDELRDVVTALNGLAAQLDEMRTAVARGERLALLGQLSAGMAHHLRNDVTGARMAVQLHRRSCDSDDQESLDVALRQLTLTEEHLKRFLAVGQPARIHKTSCNLAALAREVVDLMSPALRHRKVTVHCEVDDAQPPIAADCEQLRHVLVSLLLNASEACGPEGWVKIESLDPSTGVHSAAGAPTGGNYSAAGAPTGGDYSAAGALTGGDYSAAGALTGGDHSAAGALTGGASNVRFIGLRISDSGQGLADELAGRLFEPFATSKPEGIGLGLASARHVAEAHGGSIEYRRLGDVTSFELLLPRQAAPVNGAQSMRTIQNTPTLAELP